MRVLQVLTAADASGAYGGPLSVAAWQSQALAAEGFDVEIISTQGPGPERHDIRALKTFKSWTLSSRFAFSSRVSPPLFRYLEQRLVEVDLVHVHFARDLIPVLAARKAVRADVPVVAQTHGMYVADSRLHSRAADALGARSALLGANALIALNDWERMELVRVGASQDRIHVVPNAVPSVRRELVTSDHPSVVFIGRLHPRKRVMDFARMAVSLVKDNAVGQDVSFDIYGPDAGDLKSLNEFLSGLAMDLRNRITYHGTLDRNGVGLVLATASVFVLPSVGEPFPMALLEAMSAGVPTVSNDTSHIVDYIARYGAGLIVPAGSDGIASGVACLLKNDETCRAVVAGADRLLSVELSEASVRRRLADVYRSLF